MQKKPNLPPVEEVQVRPTGAANSSKDTMKRTGAAGEGSFFVADHCPTNLLSFVISRFSNSSPQT